MQLVGDRKAEKIGDRRAVECRQQRNRHIGAELGRIGHVGEHLHHSDQGADHAECRRAIADGAIDFLPFVEMGQEVVAVALEVVADEVVVVAVGDEADALGQERILDLDLFEPERPLLARDLGEPRDLVDQIALGDAPQGESELRPERQAMKDRRERKPDQRGGKRAAENHDRRVNVGKHPQIAAHHDERDQHDASRH